MTDATQHETRAKSSTMKGDDMRPQRKRPRSDDGTPPAAKQMRRSATRQPPKADQPPGHEHTASATASDKSTLVANLPASYAVTSINVKSSSQIKQKVTAVLQTLAEFSFAATAPKPNVVILTARGGAASKLITVVEITKREIAGAGGKWFQYSGLDGVVETATRPHTPAADSAPATDSDEFEMLKTPLARALEDRPRIRAVPLMTILLSRVRIDGLKKIYGEQTNA